MESRLCMKYFIGFVLLLFLGCSNQKEVVVANPDMLFMANACGETLNKAQKNALTELSSILQVSIEASYESTTNSSLTQFSQSSSHNIKSSTTFILKRVEYTNHTVNTHIFSPDEHCITANLTQTSLNAYIAELRIKRTNILQEISAANNHVKYNDKDKLIKSILFKTEQYNSSLQNLIPLDMSLAKYSINETEHSLASKINSLPMVKFSVKGCRSIVHTKCTVQFNSTVYDDTNRLSYLWDFGDKSTSTRVHPTHRFKNLGDYNVRLTVEDQGKQKASITKLVIVKNLKPVAKFSTRKNVYSLRDHIDFVNKSSDIDGRIIKYKWFFADNESSSQKSPRHQYSYPGTYRVRLKVYDNHHTSDTVVKTIIVKHPIELDVHAGMTLTHVKLLIGDPEERIEKFNASVQSYLYYNHWIIAKDNIVQCIVHTDGFTKTLFGYPENCEWHHKNRRAYFKN